ncbi:MAG: UDP-3-O-(3-hydroxymyristoyl)glucosamine N-acyltransferase [Opitutae bacterium]|nr:UDP-3-O-(3-hydroxymyristoyl)glucosamine N-acyltransferase [Opitutae bacterium]
MKPVEVRGGTNAVVKGISSLGEAEDGDLSFLANRKYGREVATSKASVIIVPDDFAGEPGTDQAFFLHPQPSFALDKVCAYLERRLSPSPEPGIHSTAIVHPSAEVPKDVHIGPMAVVEEGVKLGSRCVIGPQAFIGHHAHLGEESELKARAMVMDHSRIGHNCVLHPGCGVGSDGFGYETVEREHLRCPLEDHVDIVSNTTIDRARFSETRIGAGTKIDNQVQIAHNVRIGKGCFLAAQVGIAGSSTLGDYVFLGGRAGVSGHLKVGDHSRIGGSTIVYQNLPAKSFVYGDPAMPYFQAQKFNVLRSRLPDLFRRVAAIEKTLTSDP